MKKLFCVLSCLAFSTFVFSQPAYFVNSSVSSGINNTGKNYGVAIGDYNNDGLEDIYVSRHNAPNLLYRSNGNGVFTDVAASAGIAFPGTTTTSVWGDIDNDGDLDLYLGNRDEPNVLYRNEGNGTFTDISASAGVNSSFPTRSVLMGDLDKNGWLDIYVANINMTNYLFFNNGDGTFTERIDEVGANDYGIAMGAMLFDYDNDNDLDIYLTHDGNQPNILYNNNGSGYFTDVSVSSNANFAGQGMGVDCGDINNDGFLDIYITNLFANALLLNNQNGTFTNIAASVEVDDYGMGWGTAFFDYNNDGWTDIYVSNDSYFSPYPNVLYRNNGNITFDIVSENSAVSSMFGGYGVATADFNTDGRLDLMLANSGNDGNELFINQNPNPGSFVKIKLRGVQSNACAIGARVSIEAGGRKQIDEVSGGSGYASQNSLILHFGLGDATVIDKLTVRWPSGLVEVFENVALNTSYLITEGTSIVTSSPIVEAQPFEFFVYPNPFVAELKVRLALKQGLPMQLYIANLDGRKIADLHEGWMEEGVHEIDWNAGSLPAGIYQICLHTPAGLWMEKLARF